MVKVGLCLRVNWGQGLGPDKEKHIQGPGHLGQILADKLSQVEKVCQG